MKLVIAEKPSVAQSLAAVLGAKERGQGYLQGNGYVVSWCVGHLIGLAAADAYDARYSKWCYEDLPIIPEKWKYTVAPDKKDQYEVLVSLMNRPDAQSLLNGCGSAVWKIPQSGRDLRTCVPAQSMIFCMKLPCAVPRRIGWWAFPAPGCFLPYTGKL